MSGPTTAILIVDPIEVLLTAAGIRAAMSIQAGYQESAELAAQHKAEHSKLLEQQHSAGELRQQSLNQQLAQAETQFQQLYTLGHRLGLGEKIQSGRPLANPDDENADNFLRAMQDYNADIKSILLTNAAAQQDEWNDLIQSLPEFSAAISMHTVTSDVDRLLARITHLGALPEPISALVRQLEEQLPMNRKALLTNELRRQIQLHLEDVQQQQVQEASALILRQTLKELGYQVQEFSDTLFVEGGVVHFRRHEWSDYMVRMRINERTQTANFNVIRAVHAAANERSVADHLAEDRWCAEFPALLKAIEARGLGLNVTRRLDAGEVPVQYVDSQQLPVFADAEQRRTVQPLKAREIP
jgi:hypothetical protein